MSYDQVNLMEVKWVDPCFSRVIGIATNVRVHYLIKNTKCEATSIEGVLYFYRRTGNPAHGLMILDEFGADNWIELLSEPVDFDKLFVYITVKSKTDFYRLCFVSQSECERVHSLLKREVKKITKISESVEHPTNLFNSKKMIQPKAILTESNVAKLDKTPYKDEMSPSVQEFFSSMEMRLGHFDNSKMSNVIKILLKHPERNVLNIEQSLRASSDTSLMGLKDRTPAQDRDYNNV